MINIQAMPEEFHADAITFKEVMAGRKQVTTRKSWVVGGRELPGFFIAMEYLEAFTTGQAVESGDQMDYVLANPSHLISRQPTVDANMHGSNCKAH
jgi:hypothetical protein